MRHTKKREPTCRPAILAVLADKEWHTLEEIFSKVKEKVPEQRAIDAYLKNSGSLKNPRDSQIEKGRKVVIVKILSLLRHSGRVLATGNDWTRKYKLLF